MIRHGYVLGALLVTLLTVPFARAAEPLLLSKAYWVDESRQATYQDALNANFKTFEGPLTKGYKPFALWLKLKVSSQDTIEKLAVIVKPAFLRRIELYDPYFQTSNKRLIPLLSGRDERITADNHVGVDNGFVILPSTEPRDIYLRITTTTTLVAEVDVRSLSDADYGSHVTAGTLAIYFAFLLAFLLWSLVSWAVRRDLIYGLFAVRLIFSMLHMFIWFGLFRYFFSATLGASVRDNIHNFVTVGVVAVASCFNFKLISEFGVPRWLQKIAWSSLGLSVLCLLLLLSGETLLALHVNSFVVSIYLAMSVILAFFAKDTDKRPCGQMAINTIRLGFLLMAIAVVVPMMMFQNILHTHFPVVNILFLHAVISTVIFFAILTVRARQKDLLAQQSLLQYKIKERELRQENERRVEKERFLSMLTHELRNPLSVIRLMTSESSSSGKAVHKAVLEMAEIIEQVEQSEKLEAESRHGHRATVRLGTVLRDIAMEHSVLSRLDIEVPVDLAIQTDESLLRRIVSNLLDNAEKYSVENSHIRMVLEGRSNDGVDGAQISITNDVGEAGTPDAEKLFTKYYRSKGAHRRPGSGLGLFLVASWARVLGGNVSYEQIDGVNGRSSVRFSLWLPA